MFFRKLFSLTHFSPAGGGDGGGDASSSEEGETPAEDPDNPADESGKGNSDSEGKPDTVSRAAYDKVLGEKKKATDRLRQIEADIDKQKDADLAEQGKYKDIADKKELENGDLKQVLKRKELEIAMQRHGVQDEDYVKILMESAEFSDDDFKLTNEDALFSSLKESKPYLFKTSIPPKPAVDNKKPKSSSSSEKAFTLAEVEAMSPEEFDKNEKVIRSQMAEGLIK